MPVTSSPRRPTPRPRRLPATVVAEIDACKYLGIRAGARSDHRFIAIWPVVIEGRVFGRSWTLEPDGWYHAFQDDPAGAIKVGEREVRVRAVRVRSPRLLDAMERAYAVKYPTDGSKRYVRGFRTARRRAASIEFVPR
jgi:hypothetical protein